MVRDDAHGRIALNLLRLDTAEAAVVRLAGEFGNPADEGSKDIGIVVRVLALQHRTDSLESHASVDVLRRKGGESSVPIAVILDKHEIPDLHHLGNTGVHHGGRCRAIGSAIDMDFGTWTAGTGLTHFPEIILFAEPEDVCVIDIGHGLPQLFRFVIIPVNSCPESILRDSPDLGQKFPPPSKCYFLVLIAKRPVAQHFKEGVVIGISPHLLEVVMLPADADAFLRIDGAGVGSLPGCEEDILELIHAGVREEKGGVVVRNDGGALDNSVPAFFEEFQEACPYFGGVHREVSFTARA